jgi:hypothetical protein
LRDGASNGSAILQKYAKETIQETMMSTCKTAAGQTRRNSNPQLDGIALRPSQRRHAQASMRSAERVADRIAGATAIIGALCGTLVAAPARVVADLSMGAAENVARAIIRIVDAAQHRGNAHG